MKPRFRMTTLAAFVAFGLVAGCQAPRQKLAADVLVAAKVATAPNPAAGAADPVWATARSLSVTAADGANLGAKPGDKGDSQVTMKAAYTADTLYLLIQHTDPTYSVRRGPYQKQADGTWKKLKDPADKGGDDNIYYEDKWAMLWPINNSIKAFDKEGCAALCHTDQGKPYGNKYTAREGEIADLWHMKGSRTAPFGFVDDQYADHTRYDPKTSPNAGRKSDPGTTTGEYKAFGLVDGKPQFMDRQAKPMASGGNAYIKAGDEVAFDDSKFKPGDELASYLIYPLQGDRADIRVAIAYKDGVYTSVVSRKLVTGSPYDVQFKDLNARYGFGFAVFDNAQVRHATTDDPLYLVFAK
ncbi:Ethylbenzene dehydrogenase [Burkholderiales bacterium JOSHI_001]|nr:Ethylbenzene dehydrogenase [Burkholderiales bacterium JOSHI_001]